MTRFKDTLPQQMAWIHELARAEVYPEADKILQLGGHSLDPQQLIEESTIQFLIDLKEQFSECCRIFNSYSENNSRFQEVKIYNIAQTAADFMLYRSQVKLVVTNSAHGVIQIAFAQHVRTMMSVDGQMQGAQSSKNESGLQVQEIQAQIGPFREIFWTYQGERVTPEQVAKFYFAEFARATRESKRSRANQQVLLEQIKTLLQEKGLDL